jgi:hypothetical protein
MNVSIPSYPEVRMSHVPMCVVCGENEVGTFSGDILFDVCSDRCAEEAYEVLVDMAEHFDDRYDN